MWEVIFYSLISGVIGTGIGGLIGVFCAKWYKKLYVPMMALSGGIMIAISIVELLPNAIALGGILLTFCACILGVLFVLLLSGGMKTKTNLIQARKNNYSKVGLMICLAIGIHNLPEGLVIGSSQLLDSSMMMALIICMHNIPEGISMSMPFVIGGSSKKSAFFLSCISGLPTVLGGIIGYLLGGISVTVVATCYGIAAGTMLFISFEDVFSSAYMADGSKKALPYFALIGLLVGVFICTI